MNNFLKKEKIVSKTLFCKKNYGLSLKLLSFESIRHNTSYIFFTKKYRVAIGNALSASSNFNRPLKLVRRRRVEEIKKQSSWKGLRFRQGLPVNGQRTHTNASISKRINNSMYVYDI